jgi:hypothetical protein
MVRRKDEAHGRKFGWKSRILVISSFVIIFLLLIYLISFAVRTGDMLLGFVLIIIFIILIPLAIFAIDFILSHYYYLALYDPTKGD